MAAYGVLQDLRRLRQAWNEPQVRPPVQFGRAGFRAPGCVYDLDSPPLQALAQAHAEVHGRPPETLACTAPPTGAISRWAPTCR